MANLNYVHEKFMTAIDGMIGSEYSPREQLEETATHLGRLEPHDFPEGLRSEFERWVTTWFDVDSLDEFNDFTPLDPEVTDDEVRMAITELADKMWPKVRRDNVLIRWSGEEPEYDWG